MASGDATRVYQLIIDAGGSKAGAEMFKRAADQISDSAAKAVAAGKPLVDNVAAAEKAYRSLVTRIDPVTTAQTRMAREIGVVQQAFAAQKITVEQAATNLQQITTRYEAAIDRARRFGQGLGGAGSGARGFGAAIQQAGFQVGDFAVQVASGGGVLRPLIQQGTQLVSMFGPWGAVIGAAGAVVGALATSFLDLEGATKKATAAEEAHTKALEKSRELYKGIRGEVEQTKELRKAELRTIVEQAEAEYRAAQAKLAAAGPKMLSEPRTVVGRDGKPSLVGGIQNQAYRQAEQEAAAKLSYLQQQRAILDAALDDYDARIQKSFSAKPAETEAATIKTQTIAATTKAVTEYTKAAEDLDSKLNGLLSTMNLMAPGEAQIELAFEQGKISAEEYRKAINEIDAIQDKLDRSGPARTVQAIATATDDATDSTQRWSNAMGQLGATWSSAFEDAAIAMQHSGISAASLGETLRGLADDVQRVILRMSVTEPIASGLVGMFKDFDWSSLWGPGKYGIASGKMQSSGGGGGWFSDILSFFGFHGGGIAGGTPTFRRSVPTAAFAGAPRLHGGGFIGPGEVPAILKRGEGVFTAEQMASLAPAGGSGPVPAAGSGPVKVIINNNTGTPVDGTAQQQIGPDGTMQLLVTLEKKLADRFRSGQGDLRKAVGATFGAVPVAQVQRS